MTSLKKLIAVLAVSLPLAAMAQQAAAPAAAPAPLAQIYGTLNLNLQSIGATDSTAGIGANVQNRLAVSADSTNIGVKGTASVAGGFGVVYQCESSAKLDGTGTNSLCDRNSRLGLTNATYGTVFYGNWDTPFKAAYYGTKADDPFGSTDVYGANNLLGSPGFRVLSGGANGFDQRAVNSVAYWSPKFMGLGLRAQYRVPETATAKYYGQAPGGATPLSPQLWGAALNYDMGPLSVVAAWEQHRDFQSLTNLGVAAIIPAGLGALPGNVASIDNAYRIAAGYEIPTPFGPGTVAAVYEQLSYSSRATGTGTLNTLKRPAYGVSYKQRYGDHELRGRFNWADKGSCKRNADPATGVAPDCSTSGLAAHQLSLGYAYYLAASTQVYVFYNKIVNGMNATYVPGAGGSLSGAPAIFTISPGADPEAYGLGMRYAF